MRSKVIKSKLAMLILCIIGACTLCCEQAIASSGQLTDVSEGASSELLESLGISSEGVDMGEEDDNPYGTETFTMWELSELMIIDNVTYGSSYKTYTTYDYDEGEDETLWESSNKEFSLKESEVSNASASTGVNLVDEDLNRTTFLATVEMYYTSPRNEIWLDIRQVDSDGYVSIESAGVVIELGTAFTGERDGYDVTRFVSITSGDFDGDGNDSIAVFVPEYGTDGKTIPVVLLYDVTYSADKGLSVELQQTLSINTSDFTQMVYSSCTIQNAPMVQMTTGDITFDNMDELILTVSHTKDASGTTTSMVPQTTILSLDQETTKMEIVGSVLQEWDYTLYDSTYTNGKVQMSAYGAASVGDVDGDGYNELVVAGYDIGSDVRSGSTELNSGKANIGIVEYDITSQTFSYGMGGVGISVSINSALADGTYDESQNQGPIALECVNFAGTSTENDMDYIFIGGKVFQYKNTSGYYSGISVPSSSSLKLYGFKELFDCYNIFEQDDECYYDEKKDDTTNIWIESYASANFFNSVDGKEQLIFVSGRKRDSKRNEEYRHDIISIYINDNGEFVSEYKCLNNRTDTSYGNNITVAAIDYDNDSIYVNFSSKEAYFSDPEVIAVLQGAPYFTDLTSIDLYNYAILGETAYGTSTTSGYGNGFVGTVEPSVIVGFEEEISLGGLVKLGGFELMNKLYLEFQYKYEKETETTTSIEYKSNGLANRVILTMTPYIRYEYEMYIPEYTMPTESEYLSTCTTLSGTELENYQMMVEAGLEQGYDYGEWIGGFFTDYIVCIPETSRTTIVDVEVYEEIAEEEGFDSIYENVIYNEVGNPSTYPTSSEGLENYSISDDSYTYVSVGGGEIAKASSTEVTITHDFEIGYGFEVETQMNIVGTVVGGGIGASGSYSHTKIASTGVDYLGQVAGLPEETEEYGYDFAWNFATWTDTINGMECLVLGYIINPDSIESPPYNAVDFSVKDTTDSTVTLSWGDPTTTLGNGYKIYMAVDGPTGTSYFLRGTVEAGVYEFIDTGLNENTTYEYVIRAYDDSSFGSTYSPYSLSVSAHTRYGSDANVPQYVDIADYYTIAGATAHFKIFIDPAEEGDTVLYQWQKLEEYENGLTVWENISGATTWELELEKVSEDDDMSQYRCEISEFVDGQVVYVSSNEATLYVGQGVSTTSLTLSSESGEIEYTYQEEQEVSRDEEYILELLISGYEEREYTISYDDVNAVYVVNECYVEERIGQAVTGTDDSGNEILEDNGETVEVQVKNYYIVANESDLEESIQRAIENKEIVVMLSAFPMLRDNDEADWELELMISIATEEENGQFVSGYVAEEDTYEYTYDVTDWSPVIITVTKQSTEMVTVTAGDMVTLEATVNSLILGLNVEPTGTVQFIILEEGATETYTKNVTISEESNIVSLDWRPTQSSTYYICAKYLGNESLMSSYSSIQEYLGVSSNDTSSSDVTRVALDSAYLTLVQEVDNYMEFVHTKHTIYLTEDFVVNPIYSNLYYEYITYESSDETIAELLADGSIEVGEAGTAIITAYSEELKELKAEYELTVIDDSEQFVTIDSEITDSDEGETEVPNTGNVTYLWLWTLLVAISFLAMKNLYRRFIFRK